MIRPPYLFGEDLFTPRDLSAPFSGRSAETRETSKAAADFVRGFAETDRALVYKAIRHAGETGCTDKELQTWLAMPGDTERPRRIELWKAGKIRSAGKRDKHTIWVAV